MTYQRTTLLATTAVRLTGPASPALAETISAGGGVPRGQGPSGGPDGERRAGARFQLPADHLREPRISAAIYDRLRSAISTGVNADAVLPANASRSRASQSHTARDVGPRSY